MNMADTVYTKIYAAPPINNREILRYLGVDGDAPEVSALVDECIKEAQDALSYKVCYRELGISLDGDVLDLGFVKTNSAALKRNLSGCESVTVFAATVGISLDRLITRYSAVSQTKAVIFDAIGTERIEALCDVFNEDVRTKAASNGYTAHPRFSPGYGDFPIEAQRQIFSVLDCPRKIGLTLNDSMLMSPSKSVTAIIGIAKTNA